VGQRKPIEVRGSRSTKASQINTTAAKIHQNASRHNKA